VGRTPRWNSAFVHLNTQQRHPKLGGVLQVLVAFGAFSPKSCRFCTVTFATTWSAGSVRPRHSDSELRHLLLCHLLRGCVPLCGASITDRHLFEGLRPGDRSVHTTLKMKQSLRHGQHSRLLRRVSAAFPRHPPENKASVANLETFSAAGHSQSIPRKASPLLRRCRAGVRNIRTDCFRQLP